jgi:hypothetical protein
MASRIVLVDPLGEILFSGESLISREMEDEACPETKRSAESGIYPAASTPEIEIEVYDDTEIRTPRRGPRAA